MGAKQNHPFELPSEYIGLWRQWSITITSAHNTMHQNRRAVKSTFGFFQGGSSQKEHGIKCAKVQSEFSNLSCPEFAVLLFALQWLLKLLCRHLKRSQYAGHILKDCRQIIMPMCLPEHYRLFLQTAVTIQIFFFHITHCLRQDCPHLFPQPPLPLLKFARGNVLLRIQNNIFQNYLQKAMMPHSSMYHTGKRNINISVSATVHTVD